MGGVTNFIDKALNTVSNAVTSFVNNPLPVLETIALTSMGLPPMLANAAVTAANGGDMSKIAEAALTSYVGGEVGSGVAGETGSSAAGAAASGATKALIKGGGLDDIVASALGSAAGSQVSEAVGGGAAGNVAKGLTSAAITNNPTAFGNALVGAGFSEMASGANSLVNQYNDAKQQFDTDYSEYKDLAAAAKTPTDWYRANGYESVATGSDGESFTYSWVKPVGQRYVSDPEGGGYNVPIYENAPYQTPQDFVTAANALADKLNTAAPELTQLQESAKSAVDNYNTKYAEFVNDYNAKADQAEKTSAPAAEEVLTQATQEQPVTQQELADIINPPAAESEQVEQQKQVEPVQPEPQPAVETPITTEDLANIVSPPVAETQPEPVAQPQPEPLAEPTLPVNDGTTQGIQDIIDQIESTPQDDGTTAGIQEVIDQIQQAPQDDGTTAGIQDAINQINQDDFYKEIGIDPNSMTDQPPLSQEEIDSIINGEAYQPEQTGGSQASGTTSSASSGATSKSSGSASGGQKTAAQGLDLASLFAALGMGGVQAQAQAPQPIPVVEQSAGFSFDQPLDVGLFGAAARQKKIQNQTGTTKISTGGYLDDLLDSIK